MSHWKSLLLSIFGMTALLTGCVAAPNAAPVPEQEGNRELFLEGFFPLGVFGQPAESFEKWKSRGVNTVLEVPQRHDAAVWDTAARRAGLKLIRRPASDPRLDIGRKDLLAWSHWDEPDAAGRIIQWTPLFEKTYADWKKIDPNRKVFINFAGPDLTWFTQRADSYSTNYASHYPRLIAAADWIANDIYPCAGWLNKAHEARRGDVTLIAEPLRILRKMTSKPLFAFVELSEIEAGNVAGARCPTSDEVRAQIWLAIINGARGVFYFPAVVGKNGFQFDGTPSRTVAEMTRQNALIAKLGSVLQGQIDPPGLSPIATAPVHVGWRRTSKGWLLIAVNASKQAQSNSRITIGGASARSAKDLVSGDSFEIEGGSLRTDFDSHAVRVFEIGN